MPMSKPFRCRIGRHRMVQVESIPLKPKTDGRLKLTIDDFDRCEIGEATYWCDVRRCADCGKIEKEIV